MERRMEARTPGGEEHNFGTPDPESYQREKSDPDPHQSKNPGAVQDL
jgi:hypothetical protein